jgi:hypothetical protein
MHRIGWAGKKPGGADWARRAYAFHLSPDNFEVMFLECENLALAESKKRDHTIRKAARGTSNKHPKQSHRFAVDRLNRSGDPIRETGM